ncbi:MAG: PD40 domain-containing protein [Candidatus Eisenbacteria sp.]|nr:PD40 domain-containing protein [Candidatus Eisenbacteria bacterium]
MLPYCHRRTLRILLAAVAIAGFPSCGNDPLAPAWTRDSLPVTGEVLFLSNRAGDANYLYILNGDGTEALPVLPGQTAVHDATWSHDGLTIAYTADVLYDSTAYGADIYLIGRYGALPWPLVTSRGSDRQPRWSPDDASIAFLSQREQPGHGIYVINADGTRERLLVAGDFPEEWGSWSPDGTSIVVTADTSGFMRLVDVETGETTSLVEGHSPAYSPTGDWIAYHNHGIHLIKPDESEQRTLTSYGNGFRWSPQGQFLSFRDTDPYTPYALEVIGVDGTGHRTIVQYQEYWRYIRDHSWSPDENYIVFGTALDMNGFDTAIFVATLTDSTISVEQVTSFPGTNERPKWRPE